MPILVKSDDVRSGRKAKVRHRRLGVNGLKLMKYIELFVQNMYYPGVIYSITGLNCNFFLVAGFICGGTTDSHNSKGHCRQEAEISLWRNRACSQSNLYNVYYDESWLCRTTGTARQSQGNSHRILNLLTLVIWEWQVLINELLKWL